MVDKWLEELVINIGSWHLRKVDRATYQVVAVDRQKNEIRARRFGGSFVYWIGASQDFNRQFVNAGDEPPKE